MIFSAYSPTEACVTGGGKEQSVYCRSCQCHGTYMNSADVPVSSKNFLATPLYTNYSNFRFCWFSPIQTAWQRAVRQKHLTTILAFQSLNFYLHILQLLLYYEQTAIVLLFLILLAHFSSI